MSGRGVRCSSRGRKRGAAAGHQSVRRRALPACQRATLTDLFEALKNVVCPSTQKTPARWKILDHAKGFLLEKEAYLSKLLALKEVFLQDDKGPKSLEEVREEYRGLYCKGISKTKKRTKVNTSRRGRRAHMPGVDQAPATSEEESADEEVDAVLQSQSSELSASSIQEFEEYLFFYRQTLELLLRDGILSPDQTGLSVVSEAISGLWNSLLPEQRAAVQQCFLMEGSVTSVGPTNNAPCSSPDSSQLSMLNAPGTSAIEEDLLQDACDVVQRDMDAASGNGPPLVPPQSDNCESLTEIYNHIMGFVQIHLSENQKLTQDLPLTADYEELFLRCSESFDEDF